MDKNPFGLNGHIYSEIMARLPSENVKEPV